MHRTAVFWLLTAAAAYTTAAAPNWTGVLHEHPAIQYAVRPAIDRVAKLSEAIARGRVLQRDARTGYLLPVLNALGVPVESQLLVFSKTGLQRALISPQRPRALFFDESVAVGYVPGAPVVELAAHDPQQGVMFYTIDQSAASPIIFGILADHHAAHELPYMPRIGEHARRSGHARAQHRGRRRRERAAAAWQQRRGSPDAPP